MCLMTQTCRLFETIPNHNSCLNYTCLSPLDYTYFLRELNTSIVPSKTILLLIENETESRHDSPHHKETNVCCVSCLRAYKNPKLFRPLQKQGAKNCKQ